MSETDPWKVAKSTIRARIADYSVALLGHSSGSQQAKENAQTAIDVAIDAARAAEAAQHQQHMDRLTRQAQDISVTIGEAGCRAMPIVDGVRWLVDHNLQLRARLAAVEAERDRLNGALEAAPGGSVPTRQACTS